MDEHGRVIDIMIDAMQTVAKEKIPKQDMLPALIDFTAMVALIVAGEERLRAVITRLAGRIEDWRAGSFSVSNMETMH
jgi:hypothetical protein